MPYTKTIVKEGDKKTYPKKGQKVQVNYVGKFLNGKTFDSSIEAGEPFEFNVGIGQVIRAWDEGVMTMSLGEKCILKADPDYAYGKAGCGSDIPPNATLLFEVDLLKLF